VLTSIAGPLAEASLYTYLVHYQVYAAFDHHPALGVAASLGVGIVLTQAITAVRRRIAERWARLNSSAVPVLR
jgi:hypothetical protein